MLEPIERALNAACAIRMSSSAYYDAKRCSGCFFLNYWCTWLILECDGTSTGSPMLC
jgi:hypothetical protein